MTKAEEIKILVEAMYKLGPNSYCAPWLAEVIPQIKWAILSDFYPDSQIASIQDSTREAAEITNKAIDQAKDIIATAQNRATQIIDGANKYKEEQFNQAVMVLNRCVHNIQQY